VVAEDGGELEFGAGRRNDGEGEGAEEENEFFHGEGLTMAPRGSAKA
jgi:hypothetical protein